MQREYVRKRKKKKKKNRIAENIFTLVNKCAVYFPRVEAIRFYLRFDVSRLIERRCQVTREKHPRFYANRELAGNDKFERSIVARKCKALIT